VAAIKCVVGDEDLMIINKSGIAIRFPIADVGTDKGRATQGVKLIELKKRQEEIASVCVVPHEDVEEDEEEGAENAENAENVNNADATENDNQ
jgi:DNA gyrase subunit A